MQHVVRFTTAEGRDGTHFTDSLDDAVSFVERVRNVEQATDVQLFSMTEVPVSFRTYYQVQVGDSQPTPAPVRASVAAPVTAAPVLAADAQQAQAPQADAPQAHAPESSVLDTQEDEAPTPLVVDPQQTAPSADFESHDQEVDSGTPPLETRFGDQNPESAPANGRRLFSRA